MNAAELKELLTADDIIDLLHELNADPIRKGNEIHCRTICHHGNKRKLIYYIDSKTFSCFTDSCGHGIDLYILLGKVFNINFPSAFHYVCRKFNISSSGEYVSADYVDTKFIKKFKKKETQYILNEIPMNLLNGFYKIFHKTWIEDGISIKTMLKFNIMFSIRENKIIIPHFDIDNRLLGIRGRALNEDEIEAGKKYMPIYHPKNGVLKHPTGGNIYGLNVTKDKVKEYKTIILFESEKGPQQLDSMFPDMSIGGGISGSYLTDEQIKILLSLNIDNVVLALDKEWSNNEEEEFYKQKIKSGFIDKLLPYFRVQIMWDTDDLLDYKDAPTDKGIEVFKKLWNNKIHI